ncbi:MAG: glycosyltransferase family 39 protein [archaeon]|jgi:4-amino-4-deoxy-L-arabinose transferase-like glycosyltransferase
MKINNLLSKELIFTKYFSFKVKHLFLIIILLFALFLRLGFLDVAPFWVDESISSLASVNILEKGVPIFDSGAYYSRALVFHYSQALSMIVFGVTDFGARFPSVIFGLLTVLLAYLIGREYNTKAGLFAALICAVFFLEVFFSKQARFYQLFQLAFFAALFFLYKSRKNNKFLLPAVISFLIAVDTQPAGLFLVPFFIGHIILFNMKKWFYALIPTASIVFEGLGSLSLVSSSNMTSIAETSSQKTVWLYLQEYANYTTNMKILLILFIPGIIWGYFKKKDLTFLIVIPAILLLISIMFLELFALRYVYFFAFILVVFTGVFFGLLCEKFQGNCAPIVFAFFLLILIPSNIFSPLSYTTMLVPTSANLADASAPEIDTKNIPIDLVNLMKESVIVTHYSPSVEWYIKKPAYVLAFSMSGKGDNTISRTNDLNILVDVYSGSPIIFDTNLLPKNYFYVEQDFAYSKLKTDQRELASKIKNNCVKSFENKDLRVYSC